MATLQSIPQEIIEVNILTRLPVKSISRFRCVCKYWCNHLFKNHDFIRNHLNHAIVMNEFNLLVHERKSYVTKQMESSLYSIHHSVLLSALSVSSQFIGDAVRIDCPFRFRISTTQFYGSCNGLVCIELDHNDICIWNPSTTEYKQVPKIPVELPPVEALEAGFQDDYSSAYGSGYDYSIDDYKFLRIVGSTFEDVSEARVYTLGSNSWKSLGFIDYNLSYWNQRGILVDGALHCLAIAHHTETEAQVLLSFDICNETFRDMPLPTKSCIKQAGKPSLGMSEGKLVLVLENDNNASSFTVWTMKNYTWSKHLNIAEQISLDMISGRPIQIFLNGEILFESYLRKEYKVGLIVYDPKLKSERVLKIRGLTYPWGIQPYIGTLVSLNTGTFVGLEQRRKEEGSGNW